MRPRCCAAPEAMASPSSLPLVLYEYHVCAGMEGEQRWERGDGAGERERERGRGGEGGYSASTAMAFTSSVPLVLKR